MIVDTAGRLHTKHNLMAELEKMTRIAKREVPGAPHEVLLVMDATTGQNGLTQAKEFTKSAGVTGLVLTKLDGTAKGGVVTAIAKELKIPIRFVGVGEKMDDLIEFSPDDFVESLFAMTESRGRNAIFSSHAPMRSIWPRHGARASPARAQWSARHRQRRPDTWAKASTPMTACVTRKSSHCEQAGAGGARRDGLHEPGTLLAPGTHSAMRAGAHRCGNRPRRYARCEDPNPEVNGTGHRDAAGRPASRFECGILEDEARRLNEAFIVYKTEHRPFGILENCHDSRW